MDKYTLTNKDDKECTTSLTELKPLKINLQDELINHGPRIDYLYTLYGDTRPIKPRLYDHKVVFSPEPVVICSIKYINNIEDDILFNLKFKQSDFTTKTENKVLDPIITHENDIEDV